jgi:alpha-ketoglutarate-dependent taurine dioxygenase
VEAIGLGQVDLPAQPEADEGTPAVYLLRLKRVTMDPGTMPGPHHHNGAFVLSVESGAICYTLVTNDHGTVTAALSDDVGPPPGCESSIECENYLCTLKAGDTIYLPTGSTLTQTHGETHTYGNVDQETPAVVYIAEYQSHSDDAGCRGGCF